MTTGQQQVWLSSTAEIENTNLIELERIEEIVELAVLRTLFQPNEMLLKTMQRQLLLVIDVNLKRLAGQEKNMSVA